MSNVNTKSNVRTIAVTGMLSAVAVVLMYLEIPIPIMPGFIKFDFSDLPALLGAYALGPVAGIIICLIKNVVHLAASQSMYACWRTFQLYTRFSIRGFCRNCL